MSFRLVPKSVTLNDIERRNGRYFALFQRIRFRGARSLYHLLMSSCISLENSVFAFCHGFLYAIAHPSVCRL